MIELSINVVLIIISCLLFVCLFQIIMLSIMYKKEQKELQKINIYINKTEKIWYDYLMNDGPFTARVVPKSLSDILAIERIFLSYVKNVSDPSALKKIQQFANDYLSNHYESELKSRNWARRMNALYRIIDFQLENQAPICIRTSKKMKTSKEQFQLYKVQSIFNKEELINDLMDSEQTFSEIEYKQLFSLLDSVLFNQLFERFESLQKSAQYALIDVLPTVSTVGTIEMLESLLTSEDSEIRIRALKGIESVGVIYNLDPFIPFIQSSLWEERLMVTKIMSHIPIHYTYDYLKSLLEDENWWVRSEAAKSIVVQKEGIDILERFMDESKDRYAKEMANEVLARRLNLI